MKIRLAYVIDTIDSNKAGTEKQVLETIRRLDRAQFDPVLICLSPSQWLKDNKLPCQSYILNFQGFLKRNFISELNRLRKLLQEQSFQIVQTFFEDSIFITFLATRGISPRPILINSKRDIGLGLGQPWYHVLFALLRPIVIRRFSATITNSERVREYIIKTHHVNPDRVKVIYNGLQIDRVVHPIPAIFKKVKADVWIGIVANLSPVKRHDVLINAMAHLKLLCPGLNFQVIFLGEGETEKKLRDLACRLGVDRHLNFEGSVDNVSSYLQNIDIGVLCSDREGLSNAIMEYMANSLPVVATNVGGNAELVNSKNGICVPPGKPVELGEALNQLVSDPIKRKKLGSNSLQRAQSMFSWERCMAELQAYYLHWIQKS